MDYLDSRELEEELVELLEAKEDGEEYDKDRLKALEDLKAECEGYGWEYGINFIPECEFEDYAREFFNDCMIEGTPEAVKPYIDYEQFAKDLETDYSSSEFEGTTYLWREA